jgi:L-ascorbate metabolism protein UlaG (beta-lactamase superfamily)
MAIFKAFGKNPSGSRLAQIAESPQYRNGAFQNLSPTKLMAGNQSMVKNLWRFLNKPAATRPTRPVPVVKTDLKKISLKETTVIWFGHSSYFIRTNGLNILVDPVFGGHASPFPFGVSSFTGTDLYSVDDLPELDVLLITHDHYDHLDHRTIPGAAAKAKRVITSLGVGSHLVYWGIAAEKITELDWYSSVQLLDAISLTAMPARHFSGRGFVRNQTLWSSFVLQAGKQVIYIGADSGYDVHFKNIGEEYGPFDLVILESGQYNENWPLIHMMPEQAVQASLDLKAKLLLPVHWGKFALALHPWDEPVKRVLEKAAELDMDVTTPMIGEPVILGANYPRSNWWIGL